MNRNILLGLILFVAFGLGFIWFSLGKAEEVSNKSEGDGYNKSEDVDPNKSEDVDPNKSEDGSNGSGSTPISKSSDLMNDPSDTKITVPYEFQGDLGGLSLSSVIITPLEKYADGIGLTFNLEVSSEEVKVIVLDDLKRFVGEYLTDVTMMEVANSRGNHYLNVYKTSLSGLEAGQSYYYVIQGEKDYSKLYEFSTFSDEKATTMAFFGDTQGYLNSQYEAFRHTYDIAESLAKKTSNGIDLNYIAGDIVDDGGNYDQWGFFYDNVEDAFSEHQFISAIGNHDVYNGPDPYINSFNYPSNGVLGLEERSFYVDLPYARVAAFDTESTLSYRDQAQWLLDVMSDAKQAFKIVLMHRSVYPMSYNEAHIRELAVIFEAADIDLVLSGHDHIYSRTTMEADKQVALNAGVTYIVGGSSTGSKFYETIDESSRYWKNVAYDEDYPVFTLLEIGEDKIVVKAYSISEDEAQLIDSFELKDKE